MSYKQLPESLNGMRLKKVHLLKHRLYIHNVMDIINAGYVFMV